MTTTVTGLPHQDEDLSLSKGSAKVSNRWWAWFFAIKNLFSKGFSGTVVLAKITVGGTNGSLIIVSGIITTYVAPT